MSATSEAALREPRGIQAGIGRTPASAALVWHWALPWCGLVLGFALWWLASTPLLHGEGILAQFSPERSLVALAGIVAGGEIAPHLLLSLKRVVISLLLAAAIGIPLGLWVGVSRLAERSTSALFQFLRMISPLSWMPIAVMVFGIGDAPVHFLLAAAAVWPVLINTAAGVAAVDARWLLLSRSLSATRWETISRVVVPAITAHVLTGLRLAIGIIWIVLVPAEMLGVSAGLGYTILDTRDRLAYSELMAVILLIGLLGYGLDTLARRVHRRLTHQA